MGIVQVIGAADRKIVNGCSVTPQLFTMPVEAFELGKEIRIGEVFIEYANGVMCIQGGKELVARGFNGFQVKGSNIAGRADEDEVVQSFVSVV